MIPEPVFRVQPTCTINANVTYHGHIRGLRWPAKVFGLVAERIGVLPVKDKDVGVGGQRKGGRYIGPAAQVLMIEQHRNIETSKNIGTSKHRNIETQWVFVSVGPQCHWL